MIICALFFLFVRSKGTRNQGQHYWLESKLNWRWMISQPSRLLRCAKTCEMHVLYTPSCSKIQAPYITLHLSCQTHRTHADFGSIEVVQCISNTMPHSFGIHQSTDNSEDESILKVAVSNVSLALYRKGRALIAVYCLRGMDCVQ